MTFRDIFCQILSEVTGRPKIYMAELLDVFFLLHPVPNRFDEEIPEEQAQEMLSDLRKEKPGIMNWLIEGNKDYIRDNGLNVR